MTFLQTQPTAFAASAPAATSALTPEEWALVMTALSAYQHHSAFRAIYDKLQASHEGNPQGNGGLPSSSAC